MKYVFIVLSIRLSNKMYGKIVMSSKKVSKYEMQSYQRCVFQILISKISPDPAHTYVIYNMK